MSLVDITPLPAEDEIMDPATKQYVDSSAAIAEAHSDLKLAEFRATMEAYTARADEREAAASRRADEREAAASQRTEEREAAAREREAAESQRAEEREAASEARFNRMEKRLDQIEALVSSMKRFIVGASLSTALGVAAFDAALIQDFHSAFDSARYLSAVELDLQEQRKRTDALLTAMEARLAAMQKTSGQKASPN